MYLVVVVLFIVNFFGIVFSLIFVFLFVFFFFFFSSRRRHTRFDCDWSSDVCSSDLRLLSHMAGLTDGLGYAGFAPGAKVQSLEESLTRAADSPPGAGGEVRVGIAPGTKWQYSGGGYTLLQLVIEEASGEVFESYMQRAVFQPLGMNRSTFAADPDKLSNLAPLYDGDGKEATHHRFTALAAACLYTTASDMTRFIQAHLAGSGGEPAGRGVLKPETLKLMRQPHASQMGADIWGLDTMLYVPNGAGDFIIGHDGK